MSETKEKEVAALVVEAGGFMGKSKGKEWKERRRGWAKEEGGLLGVTEVEAWRRPTH